MDLCEAHKLSLTGIAQRNAKLVKIMDAVGDLEPVAAQIDAFGDAYEYLTAPQVRVNRAAGYTPQEVAESSRPLPWTAL